MSAKNTTLVGYYARIDGFGRLFFDQCKTDEEHLLNEKIEPGDDRPRCRVYADELLPKGVLGEPANWLIAIHCDPEDCPHGVRSRSECHVCGSVDMQNKSWPFLAGGS